MDPGTLALMIPIVAIVGGISAGIFKMYTEHQERLAALRVQSGGRVDTGVTDAVEALRVEVAQLRDTSTRYDMSLQHSLEELQHRVGVVESRTRPASISVGEPEGLQQRAGVGNSD